MLHSCALDSVPNGSVHTGSIFSPISSHEEQAHTNGDGVLSDQAKNDDPVVVEDDIEFPEGWKPVHYE
jgi:hypothetical protein